MLAVLEKRPLYAYGCEARSGNLIEHMLAALEERPLCANACEANKENGLNTCWLYLRRDHNALYLV